MANTQTSHAFESVTVLSQNSSTSGATIVSSGSVPGGRTHARSPHDIEGAILGYVRAIRALGRTTINSAEIAEALSIPLSDVHKAVGNLRPRGVRVIG